MSGMKSSSSTELEHCESVLHKAVRENHLDEVALLLLEDDDALLNQINERGQTPAYLAAYKGHPYLLGMLVTAGANINLPQKRGWTPLHVAAGNGHTEVRTMIGLAI